PFRHLRRPHAERPGAPPGGPDPGPAGPEALGRQRRTRREPDRLPVRRAALGEGHAHAAAPEGRLPGVRAGQGPGTVFHPDPGPAPLVPRSEGTEGTPDLVSGGPHHGREPARLDAAGRGPVARAHAVRPGPPDAPLRPGLVRPRAPLERVP